MRGQGRGLFFQFVLVKVVENQFYSQTLCDAGVETTIFDNVSTVKGKGSPGILWDYQHETHEVRRAHRLYNIPTFGVNRTNQIE